MAESNDHAFSPIAEAPVHRLNLNLLYPLDAILQAPTLTEAGRRVRLSQSAMSHALRRLRDHFGDDLMTYTGGSQYPTPLGQALRPEVRRVLREVEGALSLSLTFDPLTTTQTITIATSETIEQMLLGPVLRALSALAPGLTVNLMPIDVNAPDRSLDQGADLVLVAEEAAIRGLESLPIITDYAACMIWNEHPDLHNVDDISETQYRAARHIVARDEMTETFPLDPLGANLLRARRICVRSTSQATLPTIVIGSDLIATGSSWLFQNYASIMPLRVITAPFPRKPNVILAQWPRYRRDPMVAWFVEQIRAHVPNAGIDPAHARMNISNLPVI
ncbi:LysR family transcriptional regulator [Sphingomonas populi]|uniref:LysR family transcriptional regulator n=1 Tax=Sphingomonas populi TaxID=2484750 RepID=A0A4Q6Y790_9SPHN|nr:LysR family transcriptional regulator [Sphingomonas populi]RZF65427.1 LysR family transcriptional regulator [Sphingomonas populi]